MAKLKYFKQYHGLAERNEVDYDEALVTLLATYKDNDMTRDMLTIPNNIMGRFSNVFVEDHSGKMPMVLMAGLWNDLPMDAQYDDEGNRL